MVDLATELNSALEGRYRVERELGTGGMATVFLAQDLRHLRPVAVKVLRPELAAMIGRDRFLAEIRTTANLQHPHVLTLHDSGEAAGFLYFVMPFVDGESLRERLARDRRLPVDEALRIAGQVAGALQYAHDQGVIHRDIKPANILLSGGEPMVADFGIALAVSEAGDGRLTETGLSLGTPHYMSPEQATGEQTIGPASDIYALGCVLYEMLAGEPPYTGSTAQAVLGKIITAEPTPITSHRKAVAPNVSASVTTALEKLPADRFPSARAFAQALEDPAFRHRSDATAAATADHRRWRALAVAGAVTSVGMAVALAWIATRPEPPQRVARFTFPFAAGQEPLRFAASAFSLSPDGSFVVYRGDRVVPGGGFSLWLRRWDTLEAAPIPGTNGGIQAAISPDGRQIAFWHLGEIKVRSLEGGGVRTLVEGWWPIWGPAGDVYASVAGGVVRVPAEGGTPDTVLILSEQDASVVVTDFVPGAAALVHVETIDGHADIHAWWPESGETRRITSGTWPRYDRSGHLLYIAADGSLMAEAFDPREMASNGAARRLIEGIGAYALSDNGHLTYTTLGSSGEVDDVELVWLTRSGEVSPVEPGWKFDRGGIYFGWRISPDGDRIAFARQTGENVDVWVKHVASGTLQRLTVGEETDHSPWWTADGHSITYFQREEPGGVWLRRADGTGESTPILDHGTFQQGLWSPDGAWLILRTIGALTTGEQGGRSIVAFRPGVDESIVPLIATDFVEHAPALSPNGRWLAYASNLTGRFEVYVRPFPDVEEGNVPVSRNGGTGPVWSHDGTELFYVRGDTMVAAQVEAGPRFRVLGQQSLFEIPQEILSVGSDGWVDGQHFYDIAPDGRFLMGRRVPPPELKEPRFVLVQNFVTELNAAAR